MEKQYGLQEDHTIVDLSEWRKILDFFHDNTDIIERLNSYLDTCMPTKQETPFNEVEERIMESLVDAHNGFLQLTKMYYGTIHPSALQEWQHYIHGCESIIEHNALRRLYPNKFN